jgi:hypothetical protein
MNNKPINNKPRIQKKLLFKKQDYSIVLLTYSGLGFLGAS